MRVKILLHQGLPIQIDDFGSGIERSCVGAIHFRPGSVIDLTSDEYHHVKSMHPEVCICSLESKATSPQTKRAPSGGGKASSASKTEASTKRKQDDTPVIDPPVIIPPEHKEKEWKKSGKEEDKKEEGKKKKKG